jgi:hypothetical protein
VQTLRELIERHSEENSEFRYYIKHIEEAEANEVSHPDITIECCTALFQGVSKTIITRIGTPELQAGFEADHLHNQVRTAFKCLKVRDDVLEDALPTRALSLVQVLAELRNARGDISHGRIVPKELQSDRSLARLVLNVTEAIIRYMLASFFALQPERSFLPLYEDNEDFNTYLDDDAKLPGKLIYSRALYDQYPEDYVIRLKEFTDEQEALSEDLDAMFTAEGGDHGHAE